MSTGDPFSQFSPGNSPSNRLNGRRKVVKQLQVPASGTSTWANFVGINYQYQDSQNHRDYFKKMVKQYNPLITDDVLGAMNIGKNGSGNQNQNQRVTQQIITDDPGFTNSWVHGSGGAEAISHRLLTEIGSSSWLSSFTQMANTGIMNSIQGLLSQGVAGAGMGTNGSSGGSGAGGDNYGDLSAVWQQFAQNAINAAQNQTNSQINGQEIPPQVDITQPNAVPLNPTTPILNTNVPTSSLTVTRGPVS